MYYWFPWELSIRIRVFCLYWELPSTPTVTYWWTVGVAPRCVKEEESWLGYRLTDYQLLNLVPAWGRAVMSSASQHTHSLGVVSTNTLSGCS